jgi:hypothetical protein
LTLRSIDGDGDPASPSPSTPIAIAMAIDIDFPSIAAEPWEIHGTDLILNPRALLTNFFVPQTLFLN